MRYRRIITEDEELSSSLANLKQKFIDRSYPSSLVNKQIDKVKTIPRKDTLTYKTKQKQERNKKFIDKENLLLLTITYYLFTKKEKPIIVNLASVEGIQLLKEQKKKQGCELQAKIKNFLLDIIVYICPGLKDEVTVWIDRKKEKL